MNLVQMYVEGHQRKKIESKRLELIRGLTEEELYTELFRRIVGEILNNEFIIDNTTEEEDEEIMDRLDGAFLRCTSFLYDHIEERLRDIANDIRLDRELISSHPVEDYSDEYLDEE